MNFEIPESTPGPLLLGYATFTALTIGVMTCSVILNSMLHINLVSEFGIANSDFDEDLGATTTLSREHSDCVYRRFASMISVEVTATCNSAALLRLTSSPVTACCSSASRAPCRCRRCSCCSCAAHAAAHAAAHVAPTRASLVGGGGRSEPRTVARGPGQLRGRHPTQQGTSIYDAGLRETSIAFTFLPPTLTDCIP